MSKTWYGRLYSIELTPFRTGLGSPRNARTRRNVNLDETRRSNSFDHASTPLRAPRSDSRHGSTRVRTRDPFWCDSRFRYEWSQATMERSTLFPRDPSFSRRSCTRFKPKFDSPTSTATSFSSPSTVKRSTRSPRPKQIFRLWVRTRRSTHSSPCSIDRSIRSSSPHATLDSDRSSPSSTIHFIPCSSRFGIRSSLVLFVFTRSTTFSWTFTENCGRGDAST